MRGATVSVSADGHDPAEATVPDDGDLAIELRPNVVRGTVTDAVGDPVAGARVFVDGEDRLVETDEDGGYALPEVPRGDRGLQDARLSDPRAGGHRWRDGRRRARAV